MTDSTEENMKKKFLALTLALLMLLPLFASCKNDEVPKDGVVDKNQVDSGYETTEYVKDKFKDINYNGYEFRILAITPGEHWQAFINENSTEIWYEEDSADTLQHAVFTRNLLTEELLSVKIKPLWGGIYTEVRDKTKTLVNAGGDEMDMVHNSHMLILAQAMENYFLNLYDLKPLDVKSEWWDQAYVDTFTYRKNQLYTITGDYLTLDDYSTAVMFYNKNVVENLGLEDPADLVDAGTWTIDNMMEMARKATFDSSGDGKMDENDNWGLLDNGHALIHFIEGCDIRMTELDGDGVPQVTVDQEQFINTVQLVWEKVSTSPYTLEKTNDEDLVIIKDDRGLFYHEVLGALFNFRDMEGDFSLLPCPKMNEEQERYTSIADGIWCTALAVPITVRDPEKTATIMEVLGGMSTDTVEKALYEIVLGPQLFREPRTVDMLKYCLDARSYDWSKNVSWANPLTSALINQGQNKSFTFTSTLKSNIKIIKAQLKYFVQLLPKQ